MKGDTQHIPVPVCTHDEKEHAAEDFAGLDAKAYNDLSRRDVRTLIFYLLYAAEAFEYEESLDAIVDNFNRGFELDIPLNSEVMSVTQAVVEKRDALDEVYKPLLANWRFDRVGVSTKLILRFATWELLHTQTDPRIVINEAVELAKNFAEQDSYKFVNGVLDKIVKMREEKGL